MNTDYLFKREATNDCNLGMQANAVLVKVMRMEHVRMEEHKDVEGGYLDVLKTSDRLVEIELWFKYLGNPQLETMN